MHGANELTVRNITAHELMFVLRMHTSRSNIDYHFYMKYYKNIEKSMRCYIYPMLGTPTVENTTGFVDMKADEILKVITWYSNLKNCQVIYIC